MTRNYDTIKSEVSMKRILSTVVAVAVLLLLAAPAFAGKAGP